MRACAWLGDSTMAEFCGLLGQSGLTYEWVDRHFGARGARREARHRAVFSRVSSLEQLRCARREGISRLLIDPAETLLAGSERTPSPALLRSLESWRRGRVVLVCRPAPELLRCVHAIGRAVRSTLVLLGVDRVDALREGLRLEKPNNMLVSDDDVLSATETWPPALRDAMRAALAAPAGSSVKRVAVAGGVTRRTLERCCRRDGLPGPAALLAQGVRVSA